MTAASDAFERWAYGEGWTAGLQDGRRQGFEEGYTEGFDAGAEIGAARLLLGLERALNDRLPGVLDELLPALPDAAGYADYRRRTAWSDEPCAYGCGCCARCVRATAVRSNRARYGDRDFPGTAGSTTAHTRRGSR